MPRHDVTAAEESAERARSTGRTRLTRLVALAVILAAWLAVAGVGGPLVGRLSEVQQNDNASFLPGSAESTQVSRLSRQFSPVQALPYLVVVERTSGITPADRSAVDQFAAGIPQLPFAVPGHSMGSFLVAPPDEAIPSADGQALLLPVLLDADKAAETIAGSSPLFEGATALRTAAGTLKAQGLHVYVAGPAGMLADFVNAFSGIDGILLVVALVVVFLILLVVYRSPILPVTVLLSAMVALSAAVLAIYPLAKHDVIELNGQSQGILFILVVGATTDYALLLVARYREELHDHPSTWAAMRTAWRAASQPIVASGATVILGLLCLLLSDLGSTRGLGPVGALGIAGALLSALIFLPVILLLLGRRIFWPVVPHVDHVHAEDSVGRHGIWGRVAGMVGRHPRRTWVTTLVVLLICAAFLPTFKASGTTQAELFRDRVESVTGQEALVRHDFPGGSGTPVQIVAPEAKADQVVSITKAVNGINEVAPVPSGPEQQAPKVVDGQVLIDATLHDGADSQQAIEVVRTLRGDLDTAGPEVLVGGDTAANLDVRQATERDLHVIIPAILVVIFLVLTVLLRSLVAAVVLVTANVVSFAATVGVSALAFNHVFHFPGADAGIPLYAFVFLVALGIDYSIFLMTRVREESASRGTRPGVLVGLAVTGGVITSAGIVLAATFSALSVIPILFLVQIAFLVAFGVLLDTLVVRTLLVPAFAHELGARIWWPSRLDRPKGRHELGAIAARLRTREGNAS